MQRTHSTSGADGQGAVATNSQDRYFAAPKDSEDVDGGQLRDFVPAGLRSSAKQAHSSMLYHPPYNIASDLSPTSVLGVLPSIDGLGLAPGGGSGGGVNGPPTATTTTMSIMSPIFHFTSHDTTIVAMEHNNHCKLLALATSKKEIFVTLTQLMPVVEDAVAVMEQNGPTLDDRLQDWDPAAMTVLVDRLAYPCAQLRWAPWQHGVYLAGVCPGKEVRLYRYSHGRWALDAVLTEPSDCLAVAFSAQFTLACACRQGRIVLLTRRAAPGEEKTWTACHRFTPTGTTGSMGGVGDNRRAAIETGPHSQQQRNATAAAGAGGGPGKRQGSAPDPGAVSSFGDCLAVDFDESGSLLAVVDQNARVRVYGISGEGTKISHVAFAKDGAAGKRGGSSGGFRQVSWSPSAGRSFLILAVVFTNRIHLWFFRRPRHLNAAGMPMNAGAAAGGGGAGHHGHQQAVQLQLLAESTALCEEVAKLSWNTTGTRFVTSHSDSSVHVWALDVTYQQAQPAPLAVLLQGGTSGLSDGSKTAASLPAGATGSGSGGGARPDQKLNLVVAIRKVSSVYPYHALNAK